VPFPVKVKINIRIKINVKGVGQECPTHTGKVKVGSKINIKGVLRRDWKSRPFKAVGIEIFRSLLDASQHVTIFWQTTNKYPFASGR